MDIDWTDFVCNCLEVNIHEIRFLWIINKVNLLMARMVYDSLRYCLALRWCLNLLVDILVFLEQVFDKDIGQDERLGVAKLRLIELEAETSKELEVRLLPSLDMLKVKDKKDRGNITIKVFIQSNQSMSTLTMSRPNNLILITSPTLILKIWRNFNVLLILCWITSILFIWT